MHTCALIPQGWRDAWTNRDRLEGSWVALPPSRLQDRGAGRGGSSRQVLKRGRLAGGMLRDAFARLGPSVRKYLLPKTYTLSIIRM